MFFRIDMFMISECVYSTMILILELTAEKDLFSIYKYVKLLFFLIILITVTDT